MKRIAALFLMLYCLLCGCMAAEEAAPPTIPAAQAGGMVGYERGRLDSREQAVYDTICAALENWRIEEAIPLGGRLDAAQLEKIWGSIVLDRPEFYWARCAYPEQGGTAREVTLQLSPGMTLERAKARQREIEAAADALLQGIDGTDFEKTAALHDALLHHITYEQGAKETDAGTIYGGLVQGKGVCDAYSKSFLYLLRRLEIPAFYIGGNSIRGIPHSWNGVKLDDGWYYADITWDDVPEEKGYLYHDYFLVTREEMALDHFPDENLYGALPAGESDAFNYYRQRGYCADPARKNAPLIELAEGFARQLVDRRDELGNAPRPIFLELKVLGTYADYEAYREVFTGDVFRLLAAISARLREQGAPVAVETVGQVEYNYNDNTQVLTLFPKASALD